MSRKKQNRGWWNKGWNSIKGAFKVEEKFSNTIAQHQKKLDGMEGVEFLTEDSYDDYSYEYETDWGRDLRKKNTRKESYEVAKKDFDSGYKKYYKNDEWRGYSYYKTPSLSYKYVQQMANALAAQHRITIKVGNEWKVDLIKRELTYNPASLLYGTKSELLAALMHEIGKIRFCDHYTKLKNKYLEMYPIASTEVLSVFEDIRVDYSMLKNYPSAGEIYESAIPGVELQMEKYMNRGWAFRQSWIRAIQESFETILRNTATGSEERKIALLSQFGTSDFELVNERMLEVKKFYSENGSVYEYNAEMLNVMYDLGKTPIYAPQTDYLGNVRTEFTNIKDKVEKTIDSIEKAKKKETSQGLSDLLDIEVFPVVEDLMRDLAEKAQEDSSIKKFFPDMSNSAQQEIKDKMKSLMKSQGGMRENTDEKGNTNVRLSGPTNNEVPPEWKSGDYKALKESVSAEVKQLVNKLTFIRREELTVRYTDNQKRGKLDSKKLYKSRFGSKRLFKQKLEKVDTVQSFAFSVLMDISGSMQGNRIVHCTRALVIFTEVFKKLDIPFELIVFESSAEHIKKFDEVVNKEMEQKIGGVTRMASGGTNLHRGLEALKIEKRAERNKVVIVLSDGGVGNIENYNEQYFRPMTKRGVKSVGFGIECEQQMAELCEGNSKVLENANSLPLEFASLVKSLINKKK